MATVNYKIFKHHRKVDGTYNIKIRITHKGDAYINTSHFVSDRQLKKDLSLKDNEVLDIVNAEIADYRKKISKLGDISFWTVKDVVKAITRNESEQINFAEFCREYILSLRKQKKLACHNMQTAYNILVDYFKSEIFDAKEINYNMLVNLEKQLRQPRKIKRKTVSGRLRESITEPATSSAINNYMRDIRIMFNAAREMYNDEDSGIMPIPHYPFKKYKLPEKDTPKKKPLTVEQIRNLQNLQGLTEREELGRSLFLLSFYLCGMNLVDMYHLPQQKGERITYNRAKTKDRRKDKALMSVFIPEEARPYLHYIGKLQNQYATSRGLVVAVSAGLRSLMKKYDLPYFTHYYARHTFASLARNACRFSKDDIGLALNHVDQSNKTTDIYIEVDWKIVDDVQKGVIGLFKQSPLNADQG